MTDAEVRARNAAQLLENPLFVEALAELETRAVKAWLDTRDDAGAERERLYVWAVQARRLKAYFEGLVSNARYDAARASRAPLP